MPKMISYDSSKNPAPALGFYDTDAFPVPVLTAPIQLIQITEAQYAAQAETPLEVLGGVVQAVPYVAPIPNAAQAAQTALAALIANGLTITSTGTPAVNGTYAVDQAARANLDAVETAILANGTFLTGATTPWVLLNGTEVVIPNVTVFKAIATAVGTFYDEALLAAQTQAAGGSATWPSPTVTIP